METEKILTKERADTMYEKIAKELENNNIVGSANMIGYAMRKAWLGGFEEGRKHALGQFPDLPSDLHKTHSTSRKQPKP